MVETCEHCIGHGRQVSCVCPDCQLIVALEFRNCGLGKPTIATTTEGDTSLLALSRELAESSSESLPHMVDALLLYDRSVPVHL